MYPNLDDALGEIKAIHPTARRLEAKVDLHNISPDCCIGPGWSSGIRSPPPYLLVNSGWTVR